MKTDCALERTKSARRWEVLRAYVLGRRVPLEIHRHDDVEVSERAGGGAERGRDNAEPIHTAKLWKHRPTLWEQFRSGGGGGGGGDGGSGGGSGGGGGGEIH
jgi:hypothetical protein